MRNPVKCFGYIKCDSSSSPRSVKSLAILSDMTVRRSAVDQEDLKPYWKSGKGLQGLIKNGKAKAGYMYVHHAITKVSQLISESKDMYYHKFSMKFKNPKTSSKTYLSKRQ